MMMEVRPEATASSITYWMMGLSTRGSISLGCAFVAGRKRVPRPAAGNTALRIFWWVTMWARWYHALPEPERRRAILRGHAGPEVRRAEPRRRPGHAGEPRAGPRAAAGLSRARRGGPL